MEWWTYSNLIKYYVYNSNKDLNDVINFVNKFDGYQVCDFDMTNKSFFKIDESNIDNYISKSWENLYIIRK